ncbi:MAG: hypothetical protein QOE93_275 [Actinomycetota bacterium]|jgi:hypothetical protein|nr:hypothetical protein [Actinomycetota bacterium]
MPSWIEKVAAAAVRMGRAAVRPGPPVTGVRPAGRGQPPTPPPPVVAEPPSRKVTLRAERDGADYRHLEAYLDGEGRLHVDGQDLGPATAIVSSDGEYEWFETIAAADVPRVVEILGGQLGDDVLDILERDFTGAQSYDFEARLRASGIEVNLHTWSG